VAAEFGILPLYRRSHYNEGHPVNRHPSVPIVTPQRNWRPIAVLLATILSTAVTALGAATDTATVVRKNVAVINLNPTSTITLKKPQDLINP
jgi:hypothetical protein